MQIIQQPWPWYVAGPLIGLVIPALLLLGNKRFGISSSLRHICAACFPADISFFNYDWKREAWNLFFVGGIAIGALVAVTLLKDPQPLKIDPGMQETLKSWGVKDLSHLMPSDIFSWDNLLSLKGFFFFIIGGFMVGFGTRYAGGCTSGHAIMGLSTLQWPSLVATISFMIGGFLMSNLFLPILFKLF